MAMQDVTLPPFQHWRVPCRSPKQPSTPGCSVAAMGDAGEVESTGEFTLRSFRILGVGALCPTFCPEICSFPPKRSHFQHPTTVCFQHVELSLQAHKVMMISSNSWSSRERRQDVAGVEIGQGGESM